MEATYFPGTRVMIFDTSLYVDDWKTPLSTTMQPATVLRWYGKTANVPAGGSRFGPYQSLVDVRFDHDGRESRAHFAGGIYAEILDRPKENSMTGLQKVLKIHGAMTVNGVRWVWDYAAESPVKETEMPVNSERWKASERARRAQMNATREEEK